MKISPGPLWPVFSSFLLFGSHTSAQPAAPRVVTNSADSGPGSLRESLALAAATPGAETITFAANLSGQSLVLLSQLTIHDIDGVSVDASATLVVGVHDPVSSSATWIYRLSSYVPRHGTLIVMAVAARPVPIAVCRPTCALLNLLDAILSSLA
jgi:hypothetical protein